MTAETEVLSTGCVRQKTAGRGAYELMSPFADERVAQLYEWGAQSGHRGNRNWEKGCPFSRCIQSAKRHLNKYLAGIPDEDHDDNLAAVVFWCNAMMHYEAMIERGVLPPELDDRPDYQSQKYPAPDKKSVAVQMADRFYDHGLAELDVGCVQEPLCVYVAGPLTGRNKVEERNNCKIADEIGKLLEAKGHHVFVPHRYEYDQHTDNNVMTYERYLQFDFSLIKKWATAMFFIGQSPGASREESLAMDLGHPVFTRMDDVPEFKGKHNE